MVKRRTTGLRRSQCHPPRRLKEVGAAGGDENRLMAVRTAPTAKDTASRAMTAAGVIAATRAPPAAGPARPAAAWADSTARLADGSEPWSGTNSGTTER